MFIEGLLSIPAYLIFENEVPYLFELVSFGVAAIAVTVYIRKFINLRFGKVFYGAILASYTSGIFIDVFFSGI